MAKDLFDDGEGKVEDRHVEGVQWSRRVRGGWDNGMSGSDSAAALEEVVEEAGIDLFFIRRHGPFRAYFRGASRAESREQRRDHGHVD